MFTKKGQSVLEYSLLIAAIVAGLLIMQVYVKKAYHGKVKESADEIGKGFDPTKGYSSTWTTTGSGTTTTNEKSTGAAEGANTSETEVTESEKLTSGESSSWGLGGQ